MTVEEDNEVILVNDHEMICHQGETLLCLKPPQWFSYEQGKNNISLAWLMLMEVLTDSSLGASQSGGGSPSKIPMMHSDVRALWR